MESRPQRRGTFQVIGRANASKFLTLLQKRTLFAKTAKKQRGYRYRGRIPCFLVDFGPDPDLDPDSGCHNLNCWRPCEKD
jgi:hypothetical protein